MVGRQRTFELVPTSLVKFNASKPPMTSKAAKKAHLLATRGPKFSRAEQRRLDAEILAQQKKEYEREKASARAKAVREKKAAKEQAEKETRKMHCIPEPSKFVRASQPTISIFVNNGKKRTWLKMNNAVEESGTTSACEEVEQRFEPEGPPAKKVKPGDESEDEYGDFPFSQSELRTVLEGVESSTHLEELQNNKRERGLNVTPEPSDISKELPKISARGPRESAATAFPRGKAKGQRKVISKEPPDMTVTEPRKIAPIKGSSNEVLFEDPDTIDDIAATQLLMEVADATTWLRRQSEPTKVKKQPNPVPSISKLVCPTFRNQERRPNLKAAIGLGSALQERSVNMLPPPLPALIREKRSISFNPSPPKLRTLPRLPAQPTSMTPNLPPSSTQAFLEEHLDDFFPSPSQEIRELLDDIGDLPSNTQTARELEPNFPPSARTQDCFSGLICTQDFVLSSQDIVEITTPCPAPTPKTAELPTSAPTLIPVTPATRQPRRRFFEEKDEDLLYAAVQESKMLAAKQEPLAETMASGRMDASKVATAQQKQEVSGRTRRISNRTLSNATDYWDDEFHDFDEELIALVIVSDFDTRMS